MVLRLILNRLNLLEVLLIDTEVLEFSHFIIKWALCETLTLVMVLSHYASPLVPVVVVDVHVPFIEFLDDSRQVLRVLVV